MHTAWSSILLAFVIANQTQLEHTYIPDPMYSRTGGEGHDLSPKLTPHQTQRTRLRSPVLVNVSLLIWPQAQGSQMPASHLRGYSCPLETVRRTSDIGHWTLCLRIAFQLARLAAGQEAGWRGGKWEAQCSWHTSRPGSGDCVYAARRSASRSELYGPDRIRPSGNRLWA